MHSKLLTLHEFARQVGITERTLRRYRKRKSNPLPGTTLVGSAIMVDPDIATPWLNDPRNSPRTQARRTVTLPRRGQPTKPTAKGAKPPPPAARNSPPHEEPPPAGAPKAGKKRGRRRAAAKGKGPSAKLERAAPALESAPEPPPQEHNGVAGGGGDGGDATELARLDRLLDALMEVIEETGEVTGPVFDRYERTSKLRQSLVKAQRATAIAEARLMPREEHRVIVRTIATLIRQEVEALPAIAAEPVVDALTEAKLRVVDARNRQDGKRGLRIISEALESQVRETLQRIADILVTSAEPK